MTTEEEILSKGYSKEWTNQCIFCNSYDCHAYNDCIVCFTCKKKWENGIKTKELKPEEKAEIILWDWLKTKSLNIKEIYFNRINKLNSPTFQTQGINKKPDFIIGINRGYGLEYIAIEIKDAEISKNVHDSGKIIDYLKNYNQGLTKYIIDGKEIKIKHFAVATQFSPLGRLFKDDTQVEDNNSSEDLHRKNCCKLGILPKFEYQRTMDYTRRLWSDWRREKDYVKEPNMCSIGILIGDFESKEPYLFSMIYVDWIKEKKSIWRQRYWKL